MYTLAVARAYSTAGMALGHEIELAERAGGPNANPNGEYIKTRLGEAIQFTEIALDLDKSDTKARSELGMLLSRSGRAAEALVQYQTVIKKAPRSGSSSSAYVQAGRLLTQAGGSQAAQGIELLQRGIEYFPEQVNLYFQLGHSYQSSRQPMEAKDAYTECIKRGHKGIANWVVAHKNLAIVYLRELPTQHVSLGRVLYIKLA